MSMGTGISVEIVNTTTSRAERFRTGARELLKEAWGMLVVLAFFLALVPLFRWAGMPFDFRLSEFVSRYAAVAIAAIAWAVVLAVVQDPAEVLLPMWERYQHSPGRLLIFSALVVLLFV